MVVAYQNQVDLGQRLDRDARVAHPLWPGIGHRAHALLPYRVGEDVQARHLQQHRSVINVAGADALGHPLHDGVSRRVLDLFGPLFFVPQVLQQKLADIPRALVGTTCVVKAFAVECALIGQYLSVVGWVARS